MVRKVDEMNEAKPIGNINKLKRLAQLSNLVLLVLTTLSLTFLYLNSALFPASSDIAYFTVTALMCLVAVVLFDIQNRLQINYIFILGFISLLLLIYSQTLAVPKDASAMLTSIWAQLFFLSRPIALGLAIAATVGYLIHAFYCQANLERHSHLLALCAGTAFLGGEIVGSYWAFIGWGKSWSWSGHFFFSALTYLLFILVFHLPKAWFAGSKSLCMGKAAILGFISLMMLGYKLL